MNIKKWLWSFAILLTLGKTTTAQSQQFKGDNKLITMINRDYKVAVEQYLSMAQKLEPGKFPKTYYPQKDQFETSGSGWWCSGFYPGTLLYLYQESHNPLLLTEANRILQSLEPEQFNKSTHDLGFMMYCSFGTAEKVLATHRYREVLLNSAKSLSSRFSPKVGCIKSWNSQNSDDYLVIIDNMMNLELLFWATKTTGDSSFYKIAVQHANTTMANHFRSDYSSFHVVNYNSLNGTVKQKRTAQGYADNSAWARGQAWGLYGYTVMYRETKDSKYLNQASNIAHFILSHPNMPADKIPYWDFNAPDIPDAPRDASAAAVMASAFLELCKYDHAHAKLYFHTAETIIRNLSSAKYLATPGTNGNFVLMHSVGSLPAHSEVDVPLTYADYYFIEALGRYKELIK